MTLEVNKTEQNKKNGACWNGRLEMQWTKSMDRISSGPHIPGNKREVKEWLFDNDFISMSLFVFPLWRWELNLGTCT